MDEDNAEVFKRRNTPGTGPVHEFCRLKALITLEQVNTDYFSARKKKKTFMVINLDDEANNNSKSPYLFNIYLTLLNPDSLNSGKLSLFANETRDEHVVCFRR